MRNPDADVVVVGAGPAGSMTASILSRRGYRVIMLDRSDFPREKACGEYFSPGVVDILSRQGAAAAVLAECHCEHPGMVILASETNFMLRYDDGPIPRRSISIQRPLFDRALLGHALHHGVSVRHKARVSGVVRDGGRVTGVTVQADGRHGQITARVVVAADGLHSTVARSLGLDQPIRWPKRLGLIARYALSDDGPLSAEMHVGRHFYCALNPVAPGLVNVGMVGRLDAKRPGESVDAFYQRRLDELPLVRQRLQGARRVTRIRGMGPLARKVRRVSGEGFLLVGDAASFFDPFTGEGIYRALRGAELAADAIDAALTRGQVDPAGYGTARRHEFRRKEQLCALIQIFLGSERVFDYALDRMTARSSVARTFSGVLGDYLPASAAVRPSQLWTLLRP